MLDKKLANTMTYWRQRGWVTLERARTLPVMGQLG
jgi:hypothetical protein